MAPRPSPTARPWRPCCGGPSSNATPAPQDDSRTYHIATGALGAYNYTLYAGVSDLIEKEYPGKYKISLDAATGSTEMARLVMMGDADFGTSSLDDIIDAFNGVGEFEGLPAGQLRRLVGGQIGFGDGGGDLLPVKGGLAAVALHDFHWCCHSLQFIRPLHYIGLTGKAQYYIWRFVKSDRPGWNSGAGHGIIDKTDSEAPEGAMGRSGGICGAH